MITSAQNPRLQRLRLLNTRRKARDESEEFLIEGVRLFEEALRAEWPPRMVLFSPGLSSRGQELVARCRVLGAEVEEVDPRLLKSVLDTENPQGLAGIFAFRKRIPPSQPNFLVIADQLRDPGNLGTLLRSAEAAGAQGVYLTPGTVDAYSPKVLRAAMGAHFRLPLLAASWQETGERLQRWGLHIYLASAREGIPHTQADLRQRAAIIVGGEAAGAGAAAQQLAHTLVHIPMPGGSESLNAAAAAAILLFEAVRQRQE